MDAFTLNPNPAHRPVYKPDDLPYLAIGLQLFSPSGIVPGSELSADILAEFRKRGIVCPSAQPLADEGSDADLKLSIYRVLSAKIRNNAVSDIFGALRGYEVGCYSTFENWQAKWQYWYGNDRRDFKCVTTVDIEVELICTNAEAVLLKLGEIARFYGFMFNKAIIAVSTSRRDFYEHSGNLSQRTKVSATLKLQIVWPYWL